MIPRLVAGVLLTATLLAVAPAMAEHGTSETKDYTGGLGPALWLTGCGSDQGYNGVWFCDLDDPPPSTVTVTIRDDTGLDVPARAYFWDADEEIVKSESFCGSLTLDVPAQAVDLLVDFDPFTPQLSGPCPAVGTSGTVQASWSTS